MPGIPSKDADGATSSNEIPSDEVVRQAAQSISRGLKRVSLHLKAIIGSIVFLPAWQLQR